jgi:DNA replication licensing factor MCM6
MANFVSDCCTDGDFTNVRLQMKVRIEKENSNGTMFAFNRFEPFMRRTVRSFVLELHPDLQNLSTSNNTADISSLSFYVAVHNLPVVLPLCKLKTAYLGRLTSVTGTVTRTTEVRHELLTGSFRCNQCELLAVSLPQQYHYTRPTLCRNPRCQTTSPLQLILDP